MKKDSKSKDILGFRAPLALNRAVRTYCRKHDIKFSDFFRTAIVSKILTDEPSLAKLITEVE